MRSDITVFTALSGVPDLSKLNPVHILQTSNFKTHFSCISPLTSSSLFLMCFHTTVLYTHNPSCKLHALLITQFKNFALLQMSQYTLYLQVLTSLALLSLYCTSSYYRTTEMHQFFTLETFTTYPTSQTIYHSPNQHSTNPVIYCYIRSKRQDYNA